MGQKRNAMKSGYVVTFYPSIIFNLFVNRSSVNSASNTFPIISSRTDIKFKKQPLDCG